MFDDGRIINGEDFLELLKKGRIVVFFGDICVLEWVMELVCNVDVFVYEVMFVKEDVKFVYNYYYVMIE